MKASDAVTAAQERVADHHGSQPVTGLMGWGQQGKGAWADAPSWSQREYESFLEWKSTKGKGKGKDAGKGKGKESQDKGKGKGKGKMHKCPGNLCRDYNWGKPHYYPADAPKCDCCGLENPNCESKELAALRVATAKSAKELEAKAKKELEEKKKKKEEQEKENSADSSMPTEEEEEEEEENSESGCWLTDEFKEQQAFLKLPHPLAEGWLAEKAVKVGIAANPQLGTDTLKKAVAQCKSLLALEGAEDAIGVKIDFAATKKRLVTLEKDLAKAERATPGAKLTACELGTARERFVEAAGKTKAFADVGVLKAAERQARLVEICEETIVAWQEKLAEVQNAGKIRLEAWEKRQVELQRRVEASLAVYDQKIKAALTLADPVGAAAAAAKEAEEAAQAKAAPQEAAARKEAQKTFAKLKTVANPPLAKADLVVLDKVPPKKTVPVLAMMHYWTQCSAFTDACLPYTFKDMGATPEVAHGLVGQKVWHAYFADAVIGLDEVCPMQLRSIILHQLNLYHCMLRGTEECFLTEHAGQEVLAQQAIDAAGPRLAKLSGLLSHGGNY